MVIRISKDFKISDLYAYIGEDVSLAFLLLYFQTAKLLSL